MALPWTSALVAFRPDSRWMIIKYLNLLESYKQFRGGTKFEHTFSKADFISFCNKLSCFCFFYCKIMKTKRTQQVTIIFKSNFISKPKLLLSFYCDKITKAKHYPTCHNYYLIKFNISALHKSFRISELFNGSLCLTWLVVKRIFEDHRKFCVLCFFRIMLWEELQSTRRKFQSYLSIALSRTLLVFDSKLV